MSTTARLVRLSDVPPEQVRWLWHGRIPLGKLTILDGDPGTAKTTLALDLAARVSRGDVMPCQTGTDLDGPRGVVLLTGEDGLGDTIRPRLDAAGADVERVVALQGVSAPVGPDRLPTLQDVDALRDGIQAVDAALVIFDPIVAYLGGDVDSHRDASVRSALAGLSNLADETGVAVLAIRHLNKSESGKAMYRGGGSIGFSASARSVLLVGMDPGDPNRERRVLASVKCNLAAPQRSLAYRSVMADTGHVCIEWLGYSPHTADDLVDPENVARVGKLKQAVQWLEDELSDGPMQSTELDDRAKELGLAWKTVWRASKELGVRKTKDGFGGPWLWMLPGHDPESKATSNDLANFEDREAQDPHNERMSTKAASGPSNGQLRKKPSENRFFSDPRPKDGQDSGTDPLGTMGRPRDAEDPGRRLVSTATTLIDGGWE